MNGMNTHSEIPLSLQAGMTLSAFFYLSITSVWLRFFCSGCASCSEENNNNNNTVFRAWYKVSILLHVFSSSYIKENKIDYADR